jgi:hypothetical protein
MERAQRVARPALTPLWRGVTIMGVSPVLPMATSFAPPGAELLNAGAFMARPTASSSNRFSG